uniref:Serine/threonine-protein kinase RIO3 n=1 Tax=Parascaris univalens TaxID=6257 RepID=A0A915B884_PARUN
MWLVKSLATEFSTLCVHIARQIRREIFALRYVFHLFSFIFLSFVPFCIRLYIICNNVAAHHIFHCNVHCLRRVLNLHFRHIKREFVSTSFLFYEVIMRN